MQKLFVKRVLGRSYKVLPKHSDIVICGGGIIGASIAYQLAKRDQGKNVIVLEQNKITSGSTFHAAGLVGQLRSSSNLTQILGKSIEIYDQLEKEEGGIGWKKNGGLRIASTLERMVEFKKLVTTGKSFGLDIKMVTPKEIKEMWPILNTNDILGGIYLPTDGQANPSDLTQAFVSRAHNMGVQFLEGIGINKIHVENDRVKSLETTSGPISCDIFVNCAGQWAREVGLMAGVNVPLVSIHHQYIITEKLEGVSKNMPTLRDPDSLLYFKEDVGGIVMGGYEPNPKLTPWKESFPPRNFSFSLFDSDWDQFELLYQNGLQRIPMLGDAKIKELLNGPESFTPDGNFIMGPDGRVTNFWTCAGFNSFGIASAGGVGYEMSDWIIRGKPSMDMSLVDMTRFGNYSTSPEWIATRSKESYAKHYLIAYPFDEFQTMRPLRRSPLYPEFQNVQFGEKFGWERPNLFSDPTMVKNWNIPSWFGQVETECLLVRKNVGVVDMTSFGKFLLSGQDALEVAQYIFCNDLNKPVGSSIYTPMLNDEGGVISDVTVSRISQNEFYIVTSTASSNRDFWWIKSHIGSKHATLIDITSKYSILSMQGPKSKDVFSKLTSDDKVAFHHHKTIHIGGCPVIVMRMSYVGEIGFEFHIPIEFTVTFYKLLMKAGEAFGIGNFGYKAMESLRIEKGIRALGHELTQDYTPIESGLSFTVKLNHEFIGKKHVEFQIIHGTKCQLVMFSFQSKDVEYMAYGKETIYRNGIRVGYLSSVNYGFDVKKFVAMGYVKHIDGGIITKEYLESGIYEIEVYAKRIPVKLHLVSFYE